MAYKPCGLKAGCFMGRITDLFKKTSLALSARKNDWVDQTTLPNGLQIASQHRFLDKKLRFEIVINAGSYEDPAGKDGLAHHAEHLLLSPEKFDLIKKLGGFINARTSSSYMSVLGNIDDTPENVKILAKMLSNILQGKMDRSDFEQQKEAILNEWGMYEDDAGYIHRRLLRKIFKDERSTFHSLGFEDTIEALSFEDLETFKSAWFMAPNIKIGITGENHKILHDLLAKNLSGMLQGPTPQNRNPEFIPTDYRENNGRAKQLYFGFHFPVPPLDKKQMAVANIANHYLANLVHKRLRDELGVVYDATSLSFLEYKKQGFVSIIGSIRPKKGDIITPEIVSILSSASVMIDDDEFMIAKKYFLDELSDQAYPIPFMPRSAGSLAFDMHNLGHVMPLGKEIELYESVTSEDVRAFIAGVIAQAPAITAYGDHSKLHSYDDFVAMLRDPDHVPDAAPELASPSKPEPHH